MTDEIISEYALSPEVASDLLAIQRVADNFGVRNGRMISAFPKAWFAQAYDAVEKNKDLKSTERLRIKEVIKGFKVPREKDFFVKKGRDYNPNKSWLDACVESHQGVKFKAMLKLGQGPDDFYNVADADFNNPNSPLHQRDTVYVPRGADTGSLAKPFRLMLETGDHYKYVDKHADPEVRKGAFVAPIRYILGEIKKGRPVRGSRERKKFEFYFK